MCKVSICTHSAFQTPADNATIACHILQFQMNMGIYRENTEEAKLCSVHVIPSMNFKESKHKPTKILQQGDFGVQVSAAKKQTTGVANPYNYHVRHKT